MMKWLLKGGRVVDPVSGIDGAYDVLVSDGVIAFENDSVDGVLERISL